MEGGARAVEAGVSSAEKAVRRLLADEARVELLASEGTAFTGEAVESVELEKKSGRRPFAGEATGRLCAC